MEVKIENKKLIIVIDLQEITLSASRKALVVATTYGNVATECEIEGKKVIISFCAYEKK